MPNIIIITTHDTGRHFGCYGVDTVHTPAIDAIADDGFKFTNYLTARKTHSQRALALGRMAKGFRIYGAVLPCKIITEHA